MPCGGGASTPALSKLASSCVLGKQKLVILSDMQDSYLSMTCYNTLYQHNNGRLKKSSWMFLTPEVKLGSLIWESVHC